jgi:hypothetical protein
MHMARLVLLLTVALLAPFLQADTVTLRNNAEINGRVDYADGAFSVTARYGSGTHTTTFDRAEVRTLEFNERDFNSGAPPTDISILKGQTASATRDASHDVTKHKDGKPQESSAEQSGNSSPPKHSVLGPGEYNPSDDVIWLRNKTNLACRIIRIVNGQVTFRVDSKDRSLDSRQVAIVLVSFN